VLELGCKGLALRPVRLDLLVGQAQLAPMQTHEALDLPFLVLQIKGREGKLFPRVVQVNPGAPHAKGGCQEAESLESMKSQLGAEQIPASRLQFGPPRHSLGEGCLPVGTVGHQRGGIAGHQRSLVTLRYSQEDPQLALGVEDLSQRVAPLGAKELVLAADLG